MPPHRVARSVSRRDTPLSPPKPSPSPTNLDTRNQKERGTRSASHERVTSAQHELQNIEHVLATVHEEPDIQQSVGLASPSNFSGSAGIEHDLEELDGDNIILNLADLHDESQALLSTFEHPDDQLYKLVSALFQSGSLQDKKFQIRVKKLVTSQEAFGTSAFIDPTLIVRKLAGIIDLNQINYGLWRPDATIYLANLAILLHGAILSSSSEDDRKNLLEYLYNNFPAPFNGPDESPFGTELIDKTRDLAIEIVTQFFLNRAISDTSFAFTDVAGEIFLQDDYLLQNFQDEASQAKFLERLELLRSYFDPKSRVPTSVRVDELRQEFSWIDFTLLLAKWSTARKNELEQVVAKQGGIQSIADLLLSGGFEVGDQGPASIDEEANPDGLNEDYVGNNQVEAVNLSSSANDQLRRRRSKPVSGGKLLAEIQRLRKEKEDFVTEISGLEPQPNTTPSAADMQEIPQSPTPLDNGDNYQPFHVEDVDDDYGNQSGTPDQQLQQRPAVAIYKFVNDEIVPDQTNLVRHNLRRQSIEREKENRPIATKRSLLDRQPDARRLEWNSPGPYGAEDDPKQRPTKRPVPQRELSDDEDDDDEFQDDPRPTKVAHVRPHKRMRDEVAELDIQGGDEEPPTSSTRRRIGPITTLSRPTQISRTNIQSSSQPAATTVAARNPFQAISSSSRPPPSTAPATMTHSARSPPRTQVSRVNAEAKRVVAVTKGLHARPKVQVRKPWSDKEVDRLMEMIELYGTKWARILQEDLIHENGPGLQARDQVALKDKARNIKVDFLKARQQLPRGFEAVSIGKRYIGILRDYGVDYVEGRFTGREIETEEQEEEE